MNADKFFLNKFMDLYPHSPYLYIWRAAEAAAIAKLINKHHLNAKRILDIGCGDGIFSSVLFDKIFTGSDLSYRSLRKASSSGLYLNNIQANATSLPLKNKSFDMCFSNCVFEHIINDKSAFSEASRVLHTDGYFLISVPSDNFESMLPCYFLKKIFPAFWNKLTIKIDRSLMHHHYYNMDFLDNYLRGLDMELIDVEPYVALRQFKVWIILRTLESILKRIRMKKVNLMLSGILRNLIKSYPFLLSHYSVKNGGLAILWKKT